jgi:hypothetical protein
VDRSAASDASGLSTIRSLQPGTYSVTAHASGFSEYKVASLTAQVALSVTENVKLGLAGAGQTHCGPQTITVGQVIDPANGAGDIPEWAALPGFDDPDAGHSGFKAIA